MPGGKQTCSERSMYDFLLPVDIKDLIVIYFLAHLSVIKDPIKIKIKVLLSHFNSLLVYGLKPFMNSSLVRKNNVKIKFMSIFHIKKHSSV